MTEVYTIVYRFLIGTIGLICRVVYFTNEMHRSSRKSYMIAIKIIGIGSIGLTGILYTEPMG